jgi:tripartite-type tricarboxylate transporter receptor subunit TctC
MDKALGDAAFRASLEKIGFPVLRPKTVAEINQFVDEDRARWSKVIKAMNISLD